MNHFVVSARKYRPATFDTVVGQKAIASTLKNAIKKNMLAHAYLFFGPRGVGKTTCARIFAKTINCEHPTEAMEACNACESCLSFNENRSFNIHELDAASNNSVEDIRNLIDQVRIPPQVGKYSTYIIDEVHMLSLAAFNAFLKTLEEPPHHAIFILATTEKHKIIPTILSRCQIFDFNRIEIADIVEHLEYIAHNEGVKADPEALTIIAQKADGAMRDALSIYDQIVSFSDNDITYEKVIQNLNVLDYEYYFKIVDAFLAGDYASNLVIFDEILRKGFDGNNFLNGLARHFRDLLVCKDPGTVKLLEVGASIKEKYVRQAAQAPTGFIFDALEICNQFDINYKNSKNQKLHVELALLQITNLELKKKDYDEPVAVVSSERASQAQQKNTPEGQANQAQPLKSSESQAHQAQPVKAAESESHQVQPVKATESEAIQPQPLKSSERQAHPAQPVKAAANQPTQPQSTSGIVSAGIPNLDEMLKATSIAQPSKPTENQPIKEDTLIQDESEWQIKSLSETDLQNGWNLYLERLQTDEPRLFSALSTSPPVLESDNRLLLEVANESLLEVMNQKRQSIVFFLKNELKVKNLDLQFQLQHIDVSKVKAYTAAEKYQVLAAKNPYLSDFKTILGLDFD